MNFEECMTAELNSITEINNKIFPLKIDKGTLAPYVFYLYQGGSEYKDLNGYTGQVNSDYEINVVTKTYEELKPLTKKVINLFKSFQSRAIGDGSIFIENITFEEPVELYENQVDLFRSNIQISVDYRRN